jgi:hypothetical protein
VTVEPRRFSLVRGGPFYRLLCRARLAPRLDEPRGDVLRPSLAVIAFTWGPLMALALGEHAVEGRWEPLVRDFSVHARLLVAIPLLFLSDNALHVYTGQSVARFRRCEFADDGATVERVIASAERLRDAVLPERIILVLAVVASQALFWDLLPSAGILRSSTASIARSPTSIWYGLVALPIAQFVFVRWLWRWFIWSRLLWQLSRLRIRLAPLHPDRKGGIGFFAEPAAAFCPGLAAFSAVQAGAWMSRVVYDGASTKAFYAPFWVMVVIGVLFTHGPLFSWSGPLWQTRFRGSRELGYLAVDYARLFQRKWLEGDAADRDQLLGTSDIQSLADLANSFAIVEDIRLVPFGKRTLIIVIGAIAAPMVPLVLTQIPLAELLHRLTTVALGGLPG